MYTVTLKFEEVYWDNRQGKTKVIINSKLLKTEEEGI